MTDDLELFSGLVEHGEPSAEHIHNDMDVNVPVDIPAVDNSSPL